MTIHDRIIEVIRGGPISISDLSMEIYGKNSRCYLDRIIASVSRINRAGKVKIGKHLKKYILISE